MRTHQIKLSPRLIKSGEFYYFRCSPSIQSGCGDQVSYFKGRFQVGYGKKNIVQVAKSKVHSLEKQLASSWKCDPLCRALAPGLRNSLALRPVGHCSKLPTDPGLTQPTGAASTSGALGVRKAMCSNVANKRLEAYTKSSRNWELCEYYVKHREELCLLIFFFHQRLMLKPIL